MGIYLNPRNKGFWETVNYDKDHKSKPHSCVIEWIKG